MNNKDRSARSGNDRAPVAGTDAGERQRRTDLLLDHLGQLLPPGQRAAFRTASTTPPPASLRLNPLVDPPDELRAALERRGTATAWCPDAYTLDRHEVRLGHSLEHAVGAVYVQAKAATLAVEVLAPQPGERVLDMAAAPGGKAIQIAARMRNSGLLVLNDMQSQRMPALVGNLERCGVANAAITRLDGNRMAQYFHNYFDRILLDAPCSGDGILRKDTGLLSYWSVEDARRQAQHQKGLLRAAFHMLRPGGVLVYSTCSLSLEENEEVLLGLLSKAADKVEIMPVEQGPEQPLPAAIAARFPAALARCSRVWPHLEATEGAFVARLRKLASTEWPRCSGDVREWTAAAAGAGEAEAEQLAGVVTDLESQWGFSLDSKLPAAFASKKKNLTLQPAAAAALGRGCPGFVRAGMRVARRHRDHYFLSQQAVTMWGHSMQRAQLALPWSQTAELFRAGEIRLEPAAVPRGEVICRYGPFALCRAIAYAEDQRLDAMLPRPLMRDELTRIADYPGAE